MFLFDDNLDNLRPNQKHPKKSRTFSGTPHSLGRSRKNINKNMATATQSRESFATKIIKNRRTDNKDEQLGSTKE